MGCVTAMTGWNLWTVVTIRTTPFQILHFTHIVYVLFVCDCHSKYLIFPKRHRGECDYLLLGERQISRTGHEGPKGSRDIYTLSLTSRQDAWVVKPCLFSCTFRKDTRYPLYRRMGRPRACLDGCGYIAKGIRSPGRPARSESLYRLLYADPFTGK